MYFCDPVELNNNSDFRRFLRRLTNMATAVDQKLLRQTKFPPEFNQKVDMKKVNVEVMKKLVSSVLPRSLPSVPLTCLHRWIAGKISEILKSEDDVVIELCFNLLEGSRFVRPERPYRGVRPLTFPSPTSKRYRFRSPAFLTRTLLNFAKNYGIYV